jgi:hypothetical protein
MAWRFRKKNIEVQLEQLPALARRVETTIAFEADRPIVRRSRPMRIILRRPETLGIARPCRRPRFRGLLAIGLMAALGGCMPKQPSDSPPLWVPLARHATMYS